MNRTLELCRKTTDPKNILNVKRKDFLEKFLKGSIYYEDFLEITKNFPELYNPSQFEDDWKDSNKCSRMYKKDFVTFAMPFQDHINGGISNLVVCDIFFDGEDISFAKFSENGRFSKVDGILCDRKNGKVYRGSIPEEAYDEIYGPMKRSSASILDSFYVRSFDKPMNSDEFFECCVFMYTTDYFNIEIRNNKEKLEIHFNVDSILLDPYDITKYSFYYKTIEGQSLEFDFPSDINKKSCEMLKTLSNIALNLRSYKIITKVRYSKKAVPLQLEIYNDINKIFEIVKKNKKP